MDATDKALDGRSSMERFEIFTVRGNRNHTVKVETDSFDYLFALALTHATEDDNGIASIYPDGGLFQLACVFADGQIRHY